MKLVAYKKCRKMPFHSSLKKHIVKNALNVASFWIIKLLITVFCSYKPQLGRGIN